MFLGVPQSARVCASIDSQPWTHADMMIRTCHAAGVPPGGALGQPVNGGATGHSGATTTGA